MSVFSSIEFCLWDAQDDATNFQRNFSTGAGGSGWTAVIYHKTEYRERRNHFAYFACSEPLAGFDTQREAFLGAYRGWDKPIAVERGESSNSIAHGWQPIGSHHVKVTLAAGRDAHRSSLCWAITKIRAIEKFDPPDSQTINKRTVKPVIAKYLDPANVDAAFDALRAYWDDLLGILQVSTPDAHTNRMVNIWNAYQCMITFNMSRSASFYESGIGRGMGFRDSNQDLLGFVHMVPARARERILDLAATQLPNGGAYHQYQPLTKRGNDAVGSGFNDDPLWLVLAVAAYLKETGDCCHSRRAGALRQHAWQRDAAVRAPAARDSLHARPARAARPAADRPRRLERLPEPQLLFVRAGRIVPDPLGRRRHDDGRVGVHRRAVRAGRARDGRASLDRYGHADEAEMLSRCTPTPCRRRCLEHGWDGEWFLRAYDRFGAKVGSHECEEGRIFIEPQGMCVMAGIGLETARPSARSTRWANIWPRRTASSCSSRRTRATISTWARFPVYPPGYKENAGIFCHTNPWIMIAEAQLGHGDRAFDYYTRINPSAREAHQRRASLRALRVRADDRRARCAHARRGEKLVAHRHGGVELRRHHASGFWACGADHDGLVVDPCIPSTWDGFSVTRKFRGATYVITVHNPDHVCRGVKQVTVDGQPIAGNRAADFRR